MKGTSKTFLATAILGMILLPACGSQAGGASAESSANNTGAGDANMAVWEADDADYLDALVQTYYLAADAPAYTYLQNNSIQKFWDMWLEEYMGEETDAQWEYGTLAPVQLLDHDFTTIADPDVALYTCLFTTANGETGYIIVSYNDGDPSIDKWSLHESTPHQYDLRANLEPIAAALAGTDIDLSTATAARAEWIDTDKNRGDRIILFSDGKGDRYVCYLGDDDFTIEKQ